MFTIIVFWLGCDRPSGLLLFVYALLLSILTPLFLPSSSVSLSYFVLAVPMSECLGKQSWISSPCPIAILNGTYLFSRGKIVCNLRRSFVYQNQIKLNYTYNIYLRLTSICIRCYVPHRCLSLLVYLLFVWQVRAGGSCTVVSAGGGVWSTGAADVGSSHPRVGGAFSHRGRGLRIRGGWLRYWEHWLLDCNVRMKMLYSSTWWGRHASWKLLDCNVRKKMLYSSTWCGRHASWKQ